MKKSDLIIPEEKIECVSILENPWKYDRMNNFFHKKGHKIRHFCLIFVMVAITAGASAQDSTSFYKNTFEEDPGVPFIHPFKGFCFGTGFSFFKTSIFHFPSVNVSASVGSFEGEVFWKYSDYIGEPLNTFGVGATIYDPFLHSICLSTYFMKDADFERKEIGESGVYKITKSDGISIMGGFKIWDYGKVPFCKKEILFSAGLKFGAMRTPNLEDKIHLCADFNVAFYLNAIYDL